MKYPFYPFELGLPLSNHLLVGGGTVCAAGDAGGRQERGRIQLGSGHIAAHQQNSQRIFKSFFLLKIRLTLDLRSPAVNKTVPRNVFPELESARLFC